MHTLLRRAPPLTNSGAVYFGNPLTFASDIIETTAQYCKEPTSLPLMLSKLSETSGACCGGRDACAMRPYTIRRTHPYYVRCLGQTVGAGHKWSTSWVSFHLVGRWPGSGHPVEGTSELYEILALANNTGPPIKSQSPCNHDLRISEAIRRLHTVP